MTNPKITLKSDSPPGHSGWQGYTHYVDVFLDGKKIGRLVGRGHNKAQLEYGFDGDHPISAMWPRLVHPVGLRASKKKVEELLLRAAP